MRPTESQSAASAPPPFREAFTGAIRYWEARRIGYNVVLALIVLGWVASTWPHFRSALTWGSLLALFVIGASGRPLTFTVGLHPSGFTHERHLR